MEFVSRAKDWEVPTVDHRAMWYGQRKFRLIHDTGDDYEVVEAGGAFGLSSEAACAPHILATKNKSME